ncbi:hypothetical protein BJY01DRAFT_208829 [Aspergillus pseudoustus]|uniref:Uncharacterized protein n=1 Tax=Aspergillus pseudoustus TaxID=1810923 RepID=A0ABR4KJU5_9EURO
MRLCFKYLGDAARIVQRLKRRWAIYIYIGKPTPCNNRARQLLIVNLPRKTPDQHAIIAPDQAKGQDGEWAGGTNAKCVPSSRGVCDVGRPRGLDEGCARRVPFNCAESYIYMRLGRATLNPVSFVCFASPPLLEFILLKWPPPRPGPTSMQNVQQPSSARNEKQQQQQQQYDPPDRTR